MSSLGVPRTGGFGTPGLLSAPLASAPQPPSSPSSGFPGFGGPGLAGASGETFSRASAPLPMIPDLGVDTPTVPVPNIVPKEQYQEIPAWTYRKFQLTDLFYSKVGISAGTALSAFSILSVLNPPFVQEKSDNPIEINKPSFTVLYCISLVIFLFMMVVPVI